MPLQLSRGMTPVARQQTLILYRAVVRLQVEFSSIAINPVFSFQDISSKLEQSKVDVRRSHPYRWPPQLTGEIQRDALILCFAKMKILLDLGPTIPDSTPEEMRRETFQRFLAIDPAKTTTRQADAYSRFFCEAGIYEDGDPFWQITADPIGSLPPGLTGEGVFDSSFKELEQTDVELFCKNLIRADLLVS